MTATALAVLLTLAAPPASFRVGGDCARPAEWTAARFAEEFAGEVKPLRFSLKGAEYDARAVPLLAVLRAARPKLDPAVKSHEARFVAVVRAGDGYQLPVALGELLPDGGNRAVWVVFEVNGKPLPEAEGPVRLVVPDDKRHFRWVYGVESVTLRDLSR